MKKKERYIVILAGGKGERLWPLSRHNAPKQLLPFMNGTSLLELTIKRISSIVSKQQIVILTTRDQEELIAAQLGQSVGTILVEPEGRNTGPAILYALHALNSHNPHGAVLFLPADHFIPDIENFAHTLELLFTHCEQHPVIGLIGIKPRWPATGYGYIQTTERGKSFEQVVKFHEKPDQQQAQQYIMQNMTWNAGIFCAQITTFLAEYASHAPHLLDAFKQFIEQKIPYSALENVSFDYAVLEKSIATTACTFDGIWSDVGNLATFLSLQQTSASPDQLINVQSYNNLLYTPNKLTVLIGIENICIVETDDVLLVAKKEDVEKVKQAVHLVKNKKLLSYL